MEQTFTPMVTPLLGTKLGKLSKIALDNLEKTKVKKQDDIKEELKQLTEQSNKIVEEISKLPIDDVLSSEQVEAKLKERAKVTALIEEKRKEMGKPFLGIFPPGQIKSKLTNIFAHFAGNLASYKPELESPKIIADLEAAAIKAQEKRNEELTKRKSAQEEYEAGQKSYDQLTSELEKSEEYKENEEELSQQKTSVSEQIKMLGEKLGDVSEKFSSRIEKVTRNYENLATTLNKIDAFVRGLMSGTKVDYHNVSGLSQASVATIETLKDIPALNEYVQSALQCVSEGKALSGDLQKDKSELKDLKSEAKNIATEESENEKKLSEQKTEESSLEDRSKRERIEHRKLIDELAIENAKRIKRGDKIVPNPVFNPTEVNNELAKVKEKISELEKAKVELESKNEKNSADQSLLRDKVSELEGEIKSNKEQLKEYLTLVEQIVSKYGTEAIKSYDSSTSPFKASIDQKSLEELENIKQSR